MKKIINFFILLFLLTSFIPAFAEVNTLKDPKGKTQETLPEIFKKVEPSVVVILTYDKEGKALAQGSGFFISKDGDIITNIHVLAGAYRAEIKTTDGKIYPVTLIVAEDKDADIIRVSVNIPAESVHPLSVSNSIPEVGERITVIGSPLGLERTISDGIVSAVREIPSLGKIIQITAPISPGSSGSPVLNMKGDVIGVATSHMIGGQNLNFSVPGDKISKLKRENGKTLKEWEEGKIQEEPDSAEGLYSTGLTFLLVDDYEKALTYFGKVVTKKSSYAEAYFYIGWCNYELKHYTEASEAFIQAIRIKPNHSKAHFNLGLYYLTFGDKGSALDEYNILKDLDKYLANNLFNYIYK